MCEEWDPKERKKLRGAHNSVADLNSQRRLCVQVRCPVDIFRPLLAEDNYQVKARDDKGFRHEG